jgi:hypothetical protein
MLGVSRKPNHLLHQKEPALRYQEDHHEISSAFGIASADVDIPVSVR